MTIVRFLNNEEEIEAVCGVVQVWLWDMLGVAESVVLLCCVKPPESE